MEQDFFTEKDFYNLKRFAGQSKDSNNSEHSEVYDALLQPYEKVRRWASILQKQIFPEGYIKIRRRPTNQRNNFQEYLWAKIYPSQDSPKELAFTVEINAADKFIVKIDTVGLDENDPRRVNYENYRGSWYGSNIVLHLPYQEVNPFVWERLLEISEEFIKRNIQSYRELEVMFSRIEGNESDEGSPFDGTNDEKEINEQPKPANVSIKNPFKQTSLDSDSIHSKNSRDLLGFENDIRSFASLLALKALQPPLAIALFGKWGSGKSFFMYQLQQQIEHLREHQAFKKLSERPSQEEEPYCKGVVQITFNAWSYMDVNLWAALVAQIFEKLDHYINDADLAEEKLNEAREILAEHLTVITDSKVDLVEDKKRLLEEVELKVRQLESDIESKSSLANKEKVIEEMKGEVREKIKSKIRAEFPVEEALLTELKEQGVEEKDLSVDKIVYEFGAWHLFFKNILKFEKKHVFIIFTIALILVLIVIDPGKMISGFINQAWKNAIAFIGIVASVIGWWVKKWKDYKPFYTKLSTYRNQFNQRVEETAREDIEKDIERNKKELEQKNQEIKDIERQINKVENEIRHSITGKAFFSFIQDKRNDERYDKSLSIISTIRKDFETLSGLFMKYRNEEKEKPNEKELSEEEKKVKTDALKLQQIFNGKPLDRIILYIDDLDRCSEERVVEVLEAVNLLMAFPLFVVVVGVDPRWIKNALIKKYTLQFTGVLGEQKLVEKYKLEPIQVSDYLEKIFQIPFHLKEPEDSEVQGFLTSLLTDQTKKDKTVSQEKEGSDDEDENDYAEDGYVKDGYFQRSNLREMGSTTTQLEISTTELNNLKQLSWLVGNNPRSLKRYVNIYRIIRAHENLIYNDSESGQEKNFLCVIFLMGLCIGQYSDLSAKFYENCLKDDQKSLKDLLEELNKDESVKGIFPIHKIPKELNEFKGVDFTSYIPFVKRFSFEMNWN